MSDATFLPWMQATFCKPIYPRCGAHARSTGEPCRAKALPNGRCRNHGGLSTGPKTLEGAAISQASRQRMSSGGKEKALAGLSIVRKKQTIRRPGHRVGATPYGANRIYSANQGP